MSNIMQHFRQAEHAFIQKGEEWIEQVQRQYSFVLTPFLNPREKYILHTLCHHYGVQFFSYSYIENSERARCLIAPEYYVFNPEDFELSLLKVHYQQKFNTLTHSKVLGTLLGEGINRKYLGDIIVNQTGIYFETTKAMKEYLILNIQKMGKVPVQLVESQEKTLCLQNDYSIENTTISSFRLDNIVATVYNISRQRAKEYIQKECVQVNYAIIAQPDFQISCDDLISVRRYGRCYLTEIDEQKTKKNRFRIQYAVIRK